MRSERVRAGLLKLFAGWDVISAASVGYWQVALSLDAVDYDLILSKEDPATAGASCVGPLNP